MSALALALHHKDFNVSGSDLQRSATTEHLEAAGLTIFYGHHATQVPAHAVLIISTAIDEQNPELQIALERQQVIWHRSQVLQCLIHSTRLGTETTIGLTGTHGKTTLTGLMDSILHGAGLDVMSIAGGKLPHLNQNIRLANHPRYCVAELDESDGTILRYAPTFTILANLELDHADHYTHGLEELLHTFRCFLTQLTSLPSASPHPQTLILNGQCPHTRQMVSSLPEGVRVAWLIDRPEIVPEFKGTDDVFLIQTSGNSDASYTLSQRPINADVNTWHALGSFKLSVPGWHNAWNASMTAMVGHYLSIPWSKIAEGLHAFTGMGRRFEVLGHYQGALLVDDYAHHPTEVVATLSATRQYMHDQSRHGKLMACFQPHRYTRLKALWDDFLNAFQQADVLYLLETYHAHEAPIEGITSEAFAKALQQQFPHAAIHYAPDPAVLIQTLQSQAREGDLILSMGAGNITTLLRGWPASEKEAAYVVD